MKILFVHNKYLQSAGGEDATVSSEISLLTSKGHDVHVLYFTNEQFSGGVLNKLSAGLQAIYNRASRRKLRMALIDFKPDIIHVHNFFFDASPAVFFEASRQRIPVVATVQNFRLICVNALLLRQQQLCELCVQKFFPVYGVKYACYHDSIVQSMLVGSISAVHKLLGTWKKRIDQFIVPAEFIKNRLNNSSLHLPAGKIVVKRNFIDDPGVAVSAERKNYFLFVGRLAKEKGIDVLLECFESMPEQELIIAGDGPEAFGLKEKYGTLKNVRFAGHQHKTGVLDLMKNCRALIFPSIWYEGLPVTIVEALATGTPVIASRLGAMEEMIQDSINGLLFDKGNSEKLRESIHTFNKRVNMGDMSFYEEARKSYMQYYHPEISYSEIMIIYNKLIESFTTTRKDSR